MKQIDKHAMDYIDAATTGILSPRVLPVEDLREMLMHIKSELPSTIHLPVSSDDTLHFNRYLCTHGLVEEEQFLLLIDVPIQDCAQQLKIYQVFNLLIPQGNLSAHYDIDTKFLGISSDETKTIKILEQQFITCHGQMDNSAKLTHHFNHLLTHHHALQPFMPRIRQELHIDALYK